MFWMNEQGWLSYAPFERYQLPTLDREGTAELRRQGSVGEARELPLYRLWWPGSTHRREAILPPDELFRSWAARGLVTPHGGVPFRGYIPKEAPEAVAYHYMVNGLAERPVAGLPASAVRLVLDARFAIPKDRIPTLQYLAWLAEGHRHHPLLQGFDTVVRERLMTLGNHAAGLFFFVIGDHIYDPEKRWWRREPRWWPQLAHYLHLVGRTGCGTYEELSGLHALRNSYLLDGTEMPEGLRAVCERLDAWVEVMHESRAASRLEDPPPPVEAKHVRATEA